MDVPSTGRSPLYKIVIIAAVAAFVVILWEQHTAIQKITRENERLTTLNAELKEGLLDARTASVEAARAPQVPEPQAEPAQAESVVPAPAATPAVAENAPNTLSLDRTTVEKTDEGIVATMHFTPARSNPLGVVAIVIRVPMTGNARILDLLPKGSAKFGDVAKRVSDDGKFAVFQGTPEEVANIDFALAVSSPVQADVRGTCGIGPFALNIDDDKASAEPTQ